MELILISPGGIGTISMILDKLHFDTPSIIIVGMDDKHHPRPKNNGGIPEEIIKMFSKPINLEPPVIDFGPELTILRHSDLIQKIHERRNPGKFFLKRRKNHAFRKV